jgi:hypothetical protein
MLLIINGYISGNGGSGVIAPNGSGGAVTLVNTTISGNQTTGLNMSYTGGTNTANYIFNSVIRDNTGSNVSVSGSGSLKYYNSIVSGTGNITNETPGIPDSTGAIKNRGLNAYYPLIIGSQSLNNTIQTGDYHDYVYDVLDDGIPAGLKTEILGYLAKDRNGNNRINGTIDLGAEEQQ